MDKQAQLNQFRDEGVQLAYDAFEKQAEEGNFDMETLEKSAEARANAVIEEIAADVEFETFIKTANETITMLDEAGFEEAAEFVSKQAQEVLGGVELPAEEEEVVAGEEEGEEAETTEEEAADAAIQGAAEVVAELTGKDESDPEVLAAAEEIVTEAVEAAEEVAAAEGAGGEEEE
jgi:hypothetical protein